METEVISANELLAPPPGLPPPGKMETEGISANELLAPLPASPLRGEVRMGYVVYMHQIIPSPSGGGIGRGVILIIRNYYF